MQSGLSVQDVADRIGVHRSTLWHWRQLETFQAYQNLISCQMKEEAQRGLFSLHRKALEAIQRVMEHGADASALKAAGMVLEHVMGNDIGPTDPKHLIREAYTTNPFEELIAQTGQVVDDEAYLRRCESLGLEPE